MRISTGVGAALVGLSCGCLLLTGCSSSGSPGIGGGHGSSSATPAGSGSGQGHGGAKLSACGILTTSDVHAVLGGTVSAASTHDPDITDGPSCEYVVTGSALGVKADVFDELANNLSPASIRGEAKHPLGTDVTVNGIGDAATYDPSADGVLFTKDNRSILVEPILLDGTTPPKPAAIEASIVALARDVANRA